MLRPAALAFRRMLTVCGMAGLSAFALPVFAQHAGFNLDLRLRSEWVDDAAFSRDAEADTFRARVGYRWQPWEAWSFYAEAEHVEAFSQSYNSTANGHTEYPVVADPEATEINQAWVSYKNPTLTATLGRQRINLDNQRFIGAVGWRQNEQTFDALRFDLVPLEHTALTYAYLAHVRRVFGDDHPNPLFSERDLDAHLINASYAFSTADRLSGYAYLIEDNDVASASTRSLGFAYLGQRGNDQNKFSWRLEYANQTEYANNPGDFSVDYWLIEPLYSRGSLAIKAGWEVLGGDGIDAFQTPLATLHAFNGWADRFLTTPPNGLRDAYAGIDKTWGALKASLVLHDFAAEHGNADYGQEWDVALIYTFNAHWKGTLKVADYNADGFAVDTDKLWVQVEWVY